MNFTKVAFVLVVAAYPLIVYFGSAHLDGRSLALVLLCLATIRLLAARDGRGWISALPNGQIVGLTMVGVCAVVLLTGSSMVLRFYPALINAFMFVLFFGSLFRSPSLVERIARLREPDLSDAGVRYTRKVTMVWSVFFVFNGAMAFYTSLGTDLGIWAAYNGGLSYVLMGGLFGCEWLLRRRILRHVEGSSHAGRATADGAGADGRC